ncbi:MAG: hypothetical protein AAGD14_06935 [Planctomycetota bacterium]
MRTSIILLVLAGASLAEEPAPVAVIATQMKVIRNPDADWDAKWAAYNAMKEVAKKDNPEALAAYEAVRAEVADAVRRDTVPLSGWIMGFFGATLLWGGLAFCMGVARKAGGGMGAEE